MLRSVALPQRIAGRTAILSFAVLFAAACGGGAGDPLANSGAAIAASSVPSLGTASSFAILGGPAVTCTTSTITGDVGVAQTAAFTNTGPCTITGTVHAGDAAAAQAYNDFVVAYDQFKALPCDQTFTDTVFGNQTFTPGVYCFEAAMTSTGGVWTLDGPATGIWIFKIGTLGTGALTGTSFSVVMKDGSTVPCNAVYWWVAQAATMTDSNFVGTILAGDAITVTRGTFNGDALAKAAATVTDTNLSACAGAGGGGGGGVGHCKNSGDFVTGGGFIKLPSKAWGNFGVSGGIRNGAFWGHLNYHDHGLNGPKVKGTGVTQYLVVDAVTRHIEGTAKFNRVAGYTYKVDVADNGERGRNDTFAISVFDASNANVYSAEGTLRGGNIQLHKARVCDKDGHDKGGHGGHDDENDGHDNGFHGDDEDCGD